MIAFSWLSFHFKNSQSTAGYPCKLKQILVDFLWALILENFFRGVFKFLENIAKTPSLFKTAALMTCSTFPNMVIYVYRWISVMYGWQILRASWLYMGIVTICWIIICNILQLKKGKEVGVSKKGREPGLKDAGSLIPPCPPLLFHFTVLGVTNLSSSNSESNLDSEICYFEEGG